MQLFLRPAVPRVCATAVSPGVRSSDGAHSLDPLSYPSDHSKFHLEHFLPVYVFSIPHRTAADLLRDQSRCLLPLPSHRYGSVVPFTDRQTERHSVTAVSFHIGLPDGASRSLPCTLLPAHSILHSVLRPCSATLAYRTVPRPLHSQPFSAALPQTIPTALCLVIRTPDSRGLAPRLVRLLSSLEPKLRLSNPGVLQPRALTTFPI